MVIEKRFKIDMTHHPSTILDNGKPLCKYEVVKLLNQLWENNQQAEHKPKDFPFQFNSNCAKAYDVKNVSPNGVVRLGNGKKASWRMKDVREISKELPPFKEFNTEEYRRIRNKYAPRFGGGDLVGRIIYNIYEGTFKEYL